MSSDYLHRGDAPFGAAVWQAIDAAVVEAAKAELSARRLLHVEGPYGLGLKVVAGADEAVGGGEEGVTLSAAPAVPSVLIRKGFSLSARDVAAFEQAGSTGLATSGSPLCLRAATQAAIACARQEDAIVYTGLKSLGLTGLLNAKGVGSAKVKDWSEPGAAADDLMAAVAKLDAAGFHGPYALGLPPARYHLLLRRYPQGGGTELDHVRQIVGDAVVKAPSLTGGGLLIASGRQYATIVLGQDLMAGFVGPADGSYEFTLSESVLLRLLVPEAVCVMK